MTPPDTWFEVTAVFQVRADDEDAATHRISDAVADANIPGLFPVGTFSARPTVDPIERARALRREA